MKRFQVAFWIGFAVGMMVPPSVVSQEDYTVEMRATDLAGSIPKVYKSIGETELRLHIFQPSEQIDKRDKRPAIVFFFGGGWRGGKIGQFREQARYFAIRGMVGILADYRVQSRHGVTPFECVADAKSAIRWVRAHAEELGIDPNRIVASGGSAGGHIAACSGVIPGLDEEGEDLQVSSVPNALVLFNPALDTSGEKYKERLGKRQMEASPLHHVRPGLPPTLIIHGTDDKTVPYSQATDFCDAMKRHGNRCEVVGFEGKGHGFFNYGRGDGKAYGQTLNAVDKFLVSLGYLKKAM